MPAPDEPESITRWFHCLKTGDRQAAEVLWHHFFPRLVKVAQDRFHADRDPVYGADDAAQSVIHLLYRGAAQGRFVHVGGRDELWRLLVTAMRRKVIDRVRHNEAVKRGGADTAGELHPDIAAPNPSPETIAIMNESLAGLLLKLRDDTLRRIALRRLEGFTNAEIAAELSVSERTIERKLNLIRSDWERLV